MFAPAVKTESKLRLAFTGPSGAGKTYSALAVGTALVTGGKVALLDTEHGSASKYADIFQFDTVMMEPPFHPDRYIEVIRAAAKAGYDVLIIDSMSHAWTGTGGLLDVVNEIARARYQGNTFAAWKDGTPIQNRLVEAILAAPLHIIATMRSKTEYSLAKDEKGKSKPEKIGTAPIQRDGFEYEYDIIIDLGIDNMGVVNKTRCPALTGKVIDKPGAPLAATLRDWLHGAPPPTPDPVAAFVSQAMLWPGVDAVAFSASRLTDWVNYVTDNKFDPARAEFLAQVLDRYCSAVPDNGNKHTKAAAEKARADYEAGLTALNGQTVKRNRRAVLIEDGKGNFDNPETARREAEEEAEAEQNDLFGTEHDARQAELAAAALETAQDKG